MNSSYNEYLINLLPFIKDNIINIARKSENSIEETTDGIIELLKDVQSSNIILSRYREAYKRYKYYYEKEEEDSNIKLEQEELRSITSYGNLYYLLKNNQHLVLTQELATRFEDELDFFNVAAFCNIDKDVLQKYADKWDAKRILKSSQTNSDGWWSYEYEQHCWKLLSYNKRIKWDDDLINLFIDKIYFDGLNSENVSIKVDTVSRYWYKQNEFYGRGVISSDHDYMEGPSYYKGFFHSILKYATIQDITWKDFVKNEYRWYGVLCERNWINESIYYSCFLPELGDKYKPTKATDDDD